MRYFMLGIVVLLISAMLLRLTPYAPQGVPFNNDYYPGKTWMQYKHPEEAGFNIESLAKARSVYDSLSANSLLIVYRGKVLINWGENTRRMRTASVRKSFLSALIGKKVADKEITVDQQIQEFNFPELQHLNPVEKTATIENLLTATSGIYLPAAYETRGWTSRKPARGSHEPGTFWYYNNWDFNTLGAIYDNIADHSIAEDFRNNIADPIGMEDYRPEMDFKYFFEDTSPTPAYLFKMSARDMARFGLLYLRNGSWGDDTEIVPSNWVESSTSAKYSPWEGTGYGYLWWNTTLNNDRYMFYASGAGVQGIYIVPSLDLVMVFRANTFTGPEIEDEAGTQLLETILENYDKDEERRNPDFVAAKWQVPSISTGAFPTSQWVGSYSNNMARQIGIIKKGDKLILKTKIADFYMYPQSDSTAWVEDLNVNAILRSSEKTPNTSQLNEKELIVYKRTIN